MKILCGTVVTLGFGAALSLAAAPAFAQGAAAGPMAPAAPSDRPIDQAEPAAKARPMTIGDKPNLSGSWVLNKDQSDDARKAIEDARGSSGQNGNGQPRWGGGGPGGGGGNGNGGRRRGQNGGGPDPLDELSQLTIDQTPSSINVTGVTGRMLASFPAASQSQPKSSSDDSSGEAASAAPPPTVEWKNNQLVVIEPQGRRGTTTRTFELSPDGKQLVVTTTIDNPRFKSPATIRFVYDPASASE